jgi:hypothetical protein
LSAVGGGIDSSLPTASRQTWPEFGPDHAILSSTCFAERSLDAAMWDRAGFRRFLPLLDGLCAELAAD